MCEIPLIQGRFAHQYIRVYATIGSREGAAACAGRRRLDKGKPNTGRRIPTGVLHPPARPGEGERDLACVVDQTPTTRSTNRRRLPGCASTRLHRPEEPAKEALNGNRSRTDQWKTRPVVGKTRDRTEPATLEWVHRDSHRRLFEPYTSSPNVILEVNWLPTGTEPTLFRRSLLSQQSQNNQP